MTDPSHVTDDLIQRVKALYEERGARPKDGDWRDIIALAASDPPYYDVIIKDLRAQLEQRGTEDTSLAPKLEELTQEVAHNGCVLEAMGEELKRVRHDYMLALLRGDNSEALYTRARVFMNALEELALNSANGSAQHLIDAWRTGTHELEGWAQDMLDRAWKRAIDEGVFKVAETAHFSGSLRQYCAEQRAEGARDGYERGLNDGRKAAHEFLAWELGKPGVTPYEAAARTLAFLEGP